MCKKDRRIADVEWEGLLTAYRYNLMTVQTIKKKGGENIAVKQTLALSEPNKDKEGALKTILYILELK